MPLTNPNKVVTEERLSEFYGQILPYMGGMPDVLANKFSKGDLYSTDEKMIGCWVDSKPLYQKSVTTGGSVPSGATLIQRTTQTGYDTILYTKTTDSPISIGVDTDYSTDEKIVGTWIDGRPIYQRTYYYSTPLNVTAFGTNGAKVCSISNVDIVIHIEATAASSSGCAWNPLICWKDGTSDIRTSSAVQVSLQTCTLQYTKTS